MNGLIPWPPTDGGERAFASQAVIEGLTAFAEKRPPSWQLPSDDGPA